MLNYLRIVMLREQEIKTFLMYLTFFSKDVVIRFRCDRNMDGRVTEKDIKQVFFVSRCHEKHFSSLAARTREAFFYHAGLCVTYRCIVGFVSMFTGFHLGTFADHNTKCFYE